MTAVDNPGQDMTLGKDHLPESAFHVRSKTRRTDAVLNEAIVLPPHVSITEYSQLAEYLNQSEVLARSFATTFRKSPLFDCICN